MLLARDWIDDADSNHLAVLASTSCKEKHISIFHSFLARFAMISAYFYNILFSEIINDCTIAMVMGYISKPG